MFGVRYRNFYFEGVRSGFRWFPGERGEVDVFARINFSGLDPDQSEFLEGMEERELTVMAGVKLSYEFKRAGVEWDLAADALGRSNGAESSLVVPFPTTPGQWRLTPGVGLQWQSSNYVSYYYGVQPDEASPGRPAYEGADALNALVNVRATRAFGRERKWILIAGVEFTWLGEEIRNSPIVEDSTTTGGFLGFWYRF
jgi:outer membrane protein